MNKYRIYICFFISLVMVADMHAGRSRKNRKQKESSSVMGKTTSSPHAAHVHNKFARALQTHMDTHAFGSMPVLRPQDLNLQQNLFDNPLLPPEKSTEYTPPAEMPPVPVSQESEQEVRDIEFNFENADLQNFIQQIQDIFEVTFIADDAIKPLAQGTDKKEIKGNKISFKTHRPFSKKEAWNLFVTFLDIAGFTLVPYTDPKMYRIVTAGKNARTSPLPTFIGVDYSSLPDTDDVIRYLYFVENTTLDTIEGVIKSLIPAQAAGLITLKEQKGFILTDKAYNIKMIMQIVKELDKVTVPESMAVIKLRNANAKDVEQLYKGLLPKEETTSRFLPKKQPSLYFPENIRIIAEPRTNALIVFGPKDAINKIESFITKYIDIELDQAYSPLYTYQLKFADAAIIADIMNNITSEAAQYNPEAWQHGGVRGGDQYLRHIEFVAEKTTNRVIIKGHYEDYLKAREIIAQLDEAQPQVAIEVLVVTVNLTDTRSLGTQLRSKQPGPNGLLGNNIKFQTSGLFGQGLVTQPDSSSGTPPPGVNRLLGNLINLVTNNGTTTNSVVPVGASILTLGQDIFGVWGIFEALQSVTDAEVVSNPFLLATNNTQASVALGTIRRGVNNEIVGSGNTANAFGDFPALLDVKVTPLINSDGMITLNLNIRIDDFIDFTNFQDVTKNTRNVVTSAIVADKEVIALGGLIKDTVTDVVTKVPILGDIPILGWLFKNKVKVDEKQSLLILISAQIIEPSISKDIKDFTNRHVDDYQDDINLMRVASDYRDPVYRAFFQDKEERARKTFEGFLFDRQEMTKQREQEVLAQQAVNQPLPSTEQAQTKSNSVQSVQTVASQPVQDKLIQTIHNKKRTQLSLAEFLHSADTKTVTALDTVVNDQPIYKASDKKDST